MARPLKDGLSYFPHDTDAVNDEKIEALRFLYGNDGYAFYFILLERIYRTNEAELDISDEETVQILARKVGVSEEKFNQMLESAIKRGCFDKDEYENRKVLTSRGIKKRAGVVIEQRQRQRQKYSKSVSSDISKGEKQEETREEKTEKPEKELNKQKKSKENKSKENKSKVNNILSPSSAREIEDDDDIVNALHAAYSLIDSAERKQSGEILTVDEKPAGTATETESCEKPSTTLNEQRFNEFWAAYPRKVGKAAALKSWKRIKPDAELFEKIMTAIEKAKGSQQWKEENGRFIPHPTTWLNQGRWDDEYNSVMTYTEVTECPY